ncbi:TetR/AcrR family transcriptional regulator [Paenibacillus antri]|uniref:TetR/AcrR family transcriptional regulator n=1 Tax=Paenibacillus antri TaxID=2582848 RepID=A0A5R9GG30_9BACL|nr:TetR/AcrR family transcriptional regulator [Paenibacillus antri]TLS52338.1 TetR/AcrR family transcriptional regulator [Paenibacillus antri]
MEENYGIVDRLKISLQQIAEACQVTKATVYYYFENKAALYTDALTQSLRFANAKVQQLLRQGMPVVDKLREIAVAHLSNVPADPETFISKAEHHLNPKQIEKIRDAENAIHMTMNDFFATLQADGQLSEADTYLLAHFYTGALMMGHRSSVRNLFPAVEALADRIVDLFWRGAGAP